jgi:hypothetical protein
VPAEVGGCIVPIVQSKWRSLLGQFAFAFAFATLLSWGAYVWERSTGFTFAARYQRSHVSTPSSLTRARNLATGATVIAACLAATWLLTRRATSAPP